MTWVVYSRRGCHLCEVLIEQLLEELAGRETPEIRDIDSRSDWREKYDTRVPVVEADGELVCEHRLDRPRVQALLARDLPGDLRGS